MAHRYSQVQADTAEKPAEGKCGEGKCGAGE
ncbi:HvfA family oxazolone/thioamide-modified RiPP metallophore [Pseudomonas rossensis]